MLQTEKMQADEEWGSEVQKVWEEASWHTMRRSLLKQALQPCWPVCLIKKKNQKHLILQKNSNNNNNHNNQEERMQLSPSSFFYFILLIV